MKYIAIDLKKSMWYETDISHIANHCILPSNVRIDESIQWIKEKLHFQGSILRGNSAKPINNEETHYKDGNYIYINNEETHYKDGNYIYIAIPEEGGLT